MEVRRASVSYFIKEKINSLIGLGFAFKDQIFSSKPYPYKKDKLYSGCGAGDWRGQARALSSTSLSRSLELNPLQKNSFEKLLELPKEHFDLIYLEASWSAIYVLREAVAAWPSIKNGGLLVFDLSNLATEEIPTCEHPLNAIESFAQLNLDTVHTHQWNSFIFVKKNPS